MRAHVLVTLGVASALVGWTQLEGTRLRRLGWRAPPPRPALVEPLGALPDGGRAALDAAVAAWDGVAGGLRFGAVTEGRQIVVVERPHPWLYGEAEVARTLPLDDGEGGLCAVRIELRAGVRWREGSGEGAGSGGGVDAAAVSLAAVLAHELGHALGLGHSRDRGARMAAGLARGATEVQLGADDLAAVEALYPPAFATLVAAPCAPQGDMAAGQGDPGAVAGAGDARDSGGGWRLVAAVVALAIAALALIAAWRRRARRPR